ncbi:MAG TPA: hypothetical protein VF599_19235, partial [Pyrinomonadaceae bacterium]
MKETFKINWRHWAVGFLVWTLVGFSFALRTYFYNQRMGMDISLLPLIISYSIDFYLWGLASPLIFLLCRRFPLERKQLLRHTFFHILSAAVFIFVIIVVSVPLSWYLGIVDTAQLPTMAALFRKTITSPIMLHESLLTYWATVIVAHAFEYYREARMRETQAAQLAAQSARLSEQLVQAQLSALKMQLHPHFL